jgi:Ca2+-binding RTX toxin-like protein
MAEYQGTSADETFSGSAGPDWIYGRGGRDILSGAAGDDYVEGNEGDDVLAGDGGHDILVGGEGADILNGGEGDDYLEGGTGSDRLSGGAGDDFLYGNEGDDILAGGAGNDLLRGGAGLDSYDGGADIPGAQPSGGGYGDRVSFADRQATQGAVADLRTGIVSNDGFGNRETMAAIESLGGGTAFADTFYGNDRVNYLSGGRGDSLYGFGGDDAVNLNAASAMLDGGDGFDRLNLVTSGGLVPDANGDGSAETAPPMPSGYTVDLAAGTLVDGHGHSGTIASIESISATQLDDTLLGSAADEWFSPGAGSDTINGRGGVDTLSYRRDPYDWYFTGAAGVFIDLVAGTAVETSAEPQVLPWSQDHLSPAQSTAGPNSAADSVDTLAGMENVVGTGLGDTIYGDGGDNRIAPGAGNDIVDGRGGIDTIDYSAARASVSVSLSDGRADESGTYETFAETTAAGAVLVEADDYGSSSDRLTGIENVVGSAFHDSLYGDRGANRLEGGDGDDYIVGGLGEDVILGGAGDDHLVGDGEFGSASSIGDRDTMDGGDGHDIVSGGAGADILYGGAGEDALYGEQGDDMLVGGAGNDFMRGGAGVDTYDGGDHDSTGFLLNNNHGDRVGFADLRATQGAVADLRTGIVSNDGFGNPETMTGVESLAGGTAFADSFYGNDGSNQIRGGRGDTVMAFGSDDLLDIDGATSILDGGDGIDRLRLHVSNGLLPDANGDGVAERAPTMTTGYTIDLATGRLVDGYGQSGTILSIEAIEATYLADVLLGSGVDEWLAPGGGSDTVDGRGGVDTLSYASDPYSYYHDGVGGMFVDLAAGRAVETAAAPQIVGNGNGADIASAPTGTVGARSEARSTDTLAGIENVVGTGLGDTIYGDDADNRIAPGAGNDIVDGRGGIDTIDYSAARAAVEVRLDTGTAMEQGTGETSFEPNSGTFLGTIIRADDYAATTDQLSGIENAVGSEFDDRLVGDGGANRLEGRGGDDILEGGGSEDVLDGGAGHDTLLGGAGVDQLAGGQGNDRLDGGEGADSMAGGAGDDTYVFDELFESLLELAGEGVDTLLTPFSSALPDEVENLTLTGDDVVDANGNDLDNVLTGNANTNRLSGGAGNDRMVGRGGDDLYIVEQEGDTVVEVENEGTDTVVAFVSYALPAWVEDLALSGTAAINGTGNGLDNQLIGNAAANRLNGGAGADTMRGGQGDDTYIVDNSGDIVTELAGEGRDEVRTALGSRTVAADMYVLPANVENFTGTASVGQGVHGNALDNVMILSGGESDLILQGAGDLVVLDSGGNDRVETGGGNDFIYFGGAFTTGDSVKGGQGSDTVALLGNYSLVLEADDLVGIEKLALYSSGNAAAPNGYSVVTHNGTVAAGQKLTVIAQSLLAGETLSFNGATETDGSFDIRGGRGNDTITGGAGADRIAGNLGADTLRGGAGADIFVYRSAADSTASSRDMILDFARGDVVSLGGIDADGDASNGDSKFAFIGADRFSGTAGELRVFQDANFARAWFVEGDTDGDTIADFSLVLVAPNAYPLGKDDFWL